MSLKTSLTKGLDNDHKEEVEQSYKACSVYRKQVIRLLNEKIDAKRKESCKSSEYDSPSWAFKQADAVGFERAMRELILLLE